MLYCALPTLVHLIVGLASLPTEGYFETEHKEEVVSKAVVLKVGVGSQSQVREVVRGWEEGKPDTHV